MSTTNPNYNGLDVVKLRVANAVRVAAIVSLIAVTASSARFAIGQLRTILPLSVTTAVSISVFLTWILLLLATVGLIQRRWWGVASLGLAVLFNLGPGLTFIPFASVIVRALLPPAAAVVACLFVIDGIFLAAVAWAHTVLQRRAAISRHATERR